MTPDRDHFDEFLIHCASDMEPTGALPPSPEHWQPLHCEQCGTELKAASRYCMNCGTPVFLDDGDENLYGVPLKETRQLFEVTLVGISLDVTDSGSEGEEEPWADSGDEEAEAAPATLVRLRIQNRTAQRLCLSLTFGGSALIDRAGQQYLPEMRAEDDPDGWSDGWFYLYPGSWVEGTLRFAVPPGELAHLYVSCQPQDREEELFHFPLHRPQP